VQAFDAWMAALDERHLADLRVQEVTRALRALSVDYVRRRARVREPGSRALEGRGKRAAFALYYAPLHFLVTRQILRAVGAGVARDTIVDLGCGTGAAGAAWALEMEPRAEVVGIDRLGWALEEAGFTYRHFGLRHRVRRGDLSRIEPGARGRATGYVAAFAVNELDAASRDALRNALNEQARAGAAVLVVEPIARAIAPWWRDWATSFGAIGGRADEWRFTLPLPERVRTLARAAGLGEREQKCRSIWVP
jgi:hypothetical protein